MFQSLSRGWAMTKTSFQVLKLDKEMLVLPLLSGVLWLAAVVALSLGAIPLLDAQSPLIYLYVFGGWVLTYTIVLFFNTAVIEMATIRFNGGDPVVMDGLKKSASRFGRIVQWALIAATVGLILRILRDQARDNFIAQLLISFVEGAWHIVSYFALPIAIYRDVGPIAALKGSTSLVKRTFGESVGGIVTTGFVFLGLYLAGALVGFLLFLVGIPLLVVFALVGVYVMLVLAVQTAVNGILVAALYKYATEGTLPQAFTERGVTAEQVAW